MEKQLFWVAKDEEGYYRPMAFITVASGKMADFVQPDIDAFLKRNKTMTVVKVEITEVK